MSQESGVRSQESGVRSQESGVRSQESGVRKHYFDFLRVAACFAVMMLHIAAGNWYTLDVRSFDWQVLNFYHGALVRWAVPVFVMISGALFLSRDIPVKKLYTKYILRIAVAFVFWSFIYAAKDFVKTRDTLRFCAAFIRGHYHLWFLFMITGLYMIVPFVKRIADSESLTKYFLVLSLIFASILPELVSIIDLFSEKYSQFAGKLVDGFYLRFAAGFTIYFLLGHFLNQSEISPRAERIIYFAGLCGFAVTILLSVYASLKTGKPNHIFYNGPRMNLNTICESAAVFVFFKTHFTHESRLIRKLSAYSFGAYLVHPAVIALLRKFGIHSLSFTPIFAVPVVSVIVFVLSFTISAVLNHVPVLKKYAV